MPANTSKVSDRKIKLQQELPQLEAFYRLSKMPEWEMYLKPLLNQALTNKWLDPTKYSSDADFIRAYNQAHGRMVAYKEIILMVESASQRVEEIKRQLEVSDKSYGI